MKAVVFVVALVASAVMGVAAVVLIGAVAYGAVR